MSFQPYTYLALLDGHCEVSIPHLADGIRDLLGQEARTLNVQVADEGVILKIEDWTLRIHYNNLAYVKQESRHISGYVPGDPDLQERIAGCRHRLETTADPDPNMDYFHVVIDVLELLGKLYPVIIIDSQVGELV